MLTLLEATRQFATNLEAKTVADADSETEHDDIVQTYRTRMLQARSANHEEFVPRFIHLHSKLHAVPCDGADYDALTIRERNIWFKTNSKQIMA